MRIAIFTDTFLPQVNGVANTLRCLGNYLEAKGIEYVFITPEQKNEQMLPYNMQSFFSTPFILYPECRFTLPNMIRLNKLMDDFRPDIIFLMTEFGMGLAGLIYGKKHVIPVISNYSTNFAAILRQYKLGVLEKALDNYLSWFHNEADQCVTPSRESSKELQKYGIREVAIFSRGIDCDNFSPEKRNDEFRRRFHVEDKILLLYVGRLSPEKDLDILKTSLFKLNEKYKDKITLIVTGEGPMKAELEQTMPENVIFTGYKKGRELAEIYATCDIFAFPSSFETFGNVVLEASASGLPVVGVHEGGVLELIHHGETGYLAKPGDSESFAAHLEQLIIDPVIRHKFSINGRIFAQSKSWNSVFGNLMEIFEYVISKKTMFCPKKDMAA